MIFTFETHAMLPTLNDLLGQHPMQIHKLRNQWAIGRRNGGAVIEINAWWQRAGKPVFSRPCHLEVVHCFKNRAGRDSDNPMLKWLIDILRFPHSPSEILSNFPHLGIIATDKNNFLTHQQHIIEGADDTVIRGTITEQEAAK